MSTPAVPAIKIRSKDLGLEDHRVLSDTYLCLCKADCPEFSFSDLRTCMKPDLEESRGLWHLRAPSPCSCPLTTQGCKQSCPVTRAQCTCSRHTWVAQLQLDKSPIQRRVLFSAECVWNCWLFHLGYCGLAIVTTSQASQGYVRGFICQFVRWKDTCVWMFLQPSLSFPICMRWTCLDTCDTESFAAPPVTCWHGEECGSATKTQTRAVSGVASREKQEMEVGSSALQESPRVLLYML